MANLSEVLMRLGAIEETLADLRSALDAETENPNRKSDLEIFSRIVPSDAFLKLEGNIFLD
jgi:hypothetical protein